MLRGGSWVHVLNVPTCPCGVVPVPEQVGLDGHPLPGLRAPVGVLGVVAQPRLKVAVRNGRVKGRLWEGHKFQLQSASFELVLAH